MKRIDELRLSDYAACAFDWDGTLVDSTGLYRQLDKKMIREMYDSDADIEMLKNLMTETALKSSGDIWRDYYASIDAIYGNGNTPYEKFLQYIDKNLPTFSAQIDFRKFAVDTLLKMQKTKSIKLGLATGMERKDMEYFSNPSSKTGKQLNTLDFFDVAFTYEDVVKQKPNPEMYQKILGSFAIGGSELLVFEDSLNGIRAAKKIGAKVVNIYDSYHDNDREEIDDLSDYQIKSWREVMEII